MIGFLIGAVAGFVTGALVMRKNYQWEQEKEAAAKSAVDAAANVIKK